MLISGHHAVFKSSLVNCIPDGRTTSIVSGDSRVGKIPTTKIVYHLPFELRHFLFFKPEALSNCTRQLTGLFFMSLFVFVRGRFVDRSANVFHGSILAYQIGKWIFIEAASVEWGRHST